MILGGVLKALAERLNAGKMAMGISLGVTDETSSELEELAMDDDNIINVTIKRRCVRKSMIQKIRM